MDTMTQPHLSPDLAWRWEGTAWVPNAPELPPVAPSQSTHGKGRKRWATAGIVAGAMALWAALVFAGELGAGIAGLAVWIGFGLVAVMFLLLPVLVAHQRKHHQIGLISVFSALGLIPFLGWAFWIIALVMAAATSPTPPAAQQVVTYASR